jgi:hypothetical protein
VREADEGCDDGNFRNDDACLVSCETAFCGDGFVQEGREECDDAVDPFECVDCSLVVVDERPCSEVATDWCEARGWTVTGLAQGGHLICTALGTDDSLDCNACDTYNVVAWQDLITDRFCAMSYDAAPGTAYSGHSPCECGANLDICDEWPMAGCLPD